MKKVKDWAAGRARYGQAKTIKAKPGLATNEHAPEIEPGVYLDDGLEFCPSKTCSHRYRYKCDESDEYGCTCNDPVCKTFCT